MSYRRWVFAVVVPLLLASGAVGGGEPTSLPAAIARIVTARETLVVHVEVARSSAEREHGLMERRSLGGDEGMIFLYAAPRPGDSGFWMYRTRIPLDIAFIDGAGHIVSLQTMSPCASSDPDRCPVFRPEHGYQSALEVNAGFFAQHGVRVGDRVELTETGR